MICLHPTVRPSMGKDCTWRLYERALWVHNDLVSMSKSHALKGNNWSVFCLCKKSCGISVDGVEAWFLILHDDSSCWALYVHMSDLELFLRSHLLSKQIQSSIFWFWMKSTQHLLFVFVHLLDSHARLFLVRLFLVTLWLVLWCMHNITFWFFIFTGLPTSFSLTRKQQIPSCQRSRGQTWRAMPCTWTTQAPRAPLNPVNVHSMTVLAVGMVVIVASQQVHVLRRPYARLNSNDNKGNLYSIHLSHRVEAQSALQWHWHYAHTQAHTHTHTHHGQMTDTCDPVESLMRDYPSFKTFSATCPFRFTYL